MPPLKARFGTSVSYPVYSGLPVTNFKSSLQCIVYIEEFKARKEAFIRERFLKKLKKFINHFLKVIEQDLNLAFARVCVKQVKSLVW